MNLSELFFENFYGWANICIINSSGQNNHVVTIWYCDSLNLGLDLVCEYILTSAVMVLPSGVIKPRRPSLSTTAKPSRVTQYSIQRIYTPSRSREGPPMHTHTEAEVFYATKRLDLELKLQQTWENICSFMSDCSSKRESPTLYLKLISQH